MSQSTTAFISQVARQDPAHSKALGTPGMLMHMPGQHLTVSPMVPGVCASQCSAVLVDSCPHAYGDLTGRSLDDLFDEPLTYNRLCNTLRRGVKLKGLLRGKSWCLCPTLTP